MAANGVFIGLDGIETRQTKDVGESILEGIPTIRAFFRKKKIRESITKWFEEEHRPI
jgi:hypothetical protein